MSQTQTLGNGNPDGTRVVASTTELLSFYGGTPVAQRSGASQTALPTTALPTTNITTTTGGDGARAAAIDALRDRVNLIQTLVVEIRATLVENAMIAGGS